MEYFAYNTLKVLHPLANQFVLCDNWFCDMPGHTDPNRAFIHCATTGVAGIDETNHGVIDEPSIFYSGFTNSRGLSSSQLLSLEVF